MKKEENIILNEEGIDSLQNALSKAHARYQPYINLTNERYDLNNLYEEKTLKKIQEYSIKSVYFTVEQLQLDQEFATLIDKMTKAGVREIFLFCHKDKSHLNTQQFNDFLQDNNVRINLKVAQLTEKNISNIQKDSIGSKDLLGFTTLKTTRDWHYNFKDIIIKYTNGETVSLLNNKNSGEIILQNHDNYLDSLSEEYSLDVKEPIYIDESTKDDVEKRIKDPNQHKAKFSVEKTMNTNVYLNAGVSIGVENESELDLNLEHIEYKYSRYEAKTKLIELHKLFFFECYIKGEASPYDDDYLSNVIDQIFNSSAKIEYIDKEALETVLRNLQAFEKGISLNNIHEGLAFHKGVVFAYNNRPTDMPKNDLTVILDNQFSSITNPLEYSWLFYATKGSKNLSDLYKTDIAPEVYGEDTHPFAKKITDTALDIPMNQFYKEYDIDPNSKSPSYTKTITDWHDMEHENLPRGVNFINSIRDDISSRMTNLNELVERNPSIINDVTDNIDGITDNIVFFKGLNQEIYNRALFHSDEAIKGIEQLLSILKIDNILHKDYIKIKEYIEFIAFLENSNLEFIPNNEQKYLQGVLSKLKELNFLNIFNCISSKNPSSANFLLSEDKKAFFHKLFTEIAPPNDEEKLDFFKQIIPDHTDNNDFIDFFEGINGSYQIWQKFLAEAEIDSPEDKDYLKNIFFEIIKDKATRSNFKVVANRLINILDNSIKNGGGIKEQLEYIKEAPHIVDDSSYFSRAEENKLNTVNKLTPLFSEHSDAYTVEDILKSLNNKHNYEKDERYVKGRHEHFDIVTYLSKIPPHLRPHINIHEKYIFSWGSYDRANTESDLNDQCFKDFDVKFTKHPYLQTKNYAKSKAFKDAKGNIMPRSYPTSIDYFFKEGLINKADGDLVKLQNELSKTPFTWVEDTCYAQAGIILDDGTNLVQGYTLEQANENMKLALLNIVSSVNQFYDKNIPTQDFEQYVSLFNILFEEVKPSENVQIATRDFQGKLTPWNALDIGDTFEKDAQEQDVLDKEEAHQKLIHTFINIFTNNQEFNFNQVVALGLVEIFCGKKAGDNAINIAKELLQYDQYFTHFVRVMVGSAQITTNNYEELKKVAEAINNTLEFLTKGVGNYIKMHEFITQNGDHAENLVFFASIFAREEATEEELQEFLNNLTKLPQTLKNELYLSFAQNILPYAKGEIIESKLPKLTIEALADEQAVQNIIDSIDRVIHEDITKFNDITLEARLKAKIDLTTLEEKYSVDLSSLKEKNYLELKKEIIEQEFLIENIINEQTKEKIYKDFQDSLPSYVKKNIAQKLKELTYKFKVEEYYINKINNFTTKKNEITNHIKNTLGGIFFEYKTIEEFLQGIREILNDNSLEQQFWNCFLDEEISSGNAIKEFSFDLLYNMFLAVSNETGVKKLTKKLVKLLYNPEESLHKQIYRIEASKETIDKLLLRLPHKQEKEQFVSTLLKEPTIEKEVLNKLLICLKSINTETLTEYGHTLTTLLESASNEFINDHFESFQLATEFYFSNELEISLKELYSFVYNLSSSKYGIKTVSKVLEYCTDNSDYTIIEILSNYKAKSSNIDKVIDWLTSITPEEIGMLQDSLEGGINKLLSIKSIGKIKVISDIVLEWNEELSADEYKVLIKHIEKHKVSEAKLLKSYLFTPRYVISKPELKELVLDNLSNLDNLKILFSEKNLERFEYDQTRVVSKIEEMAYKHAGTNGEDLKLLLAEQVELYQCFKTVMERAKEYSEYTILELRELAIKAKHDRALLKHGKLSEIRNLELDFLAIASNVMYRETGKFPRDTQLLSILNTLVQEHHIAQEIATGQGKSLITAMHASYLWFTGQTVDVVSSSKHLANEGLKEFATFYKNLGINCGESPITPDSEVSEYIKGGINYSTASDMALFRANREFTKETYDPTLNTDVSVIVDETDVVLTSEINYKLAVPSINTSQLETKALFSVILDFTYTNTFLNKNVSKEDDVENLKLYLKWQFQSYNSSYKNYPLTPMQERELSLKMATDETAKKLYYLNKALGKYGDDSDALFDKLLDAATTAKGLKEGKDFVILKEDIDNEEALIQAVPIIKDQPSKGTLFGDGVQTFLHILLGKSDKYMDIAERFDTSPPTSTIFNISPKNFLIYYDLAKGRIIGLSGTVGTAAEVLEFREINKIVSFSHPRFEDDLKEIESELVNNKAAQYEKLDKILQDISSGRPVIIFAETPNDAEEVYKKLNSTYNNVELYASSKSDTGTLEEVVEGAGNYSTITIVTPALGRGVDYKTDFAEGFLGINLCTSITNSTLLQIYGRIARNGAKGKIISLFNKEQLEEEEDTVEKHQSNISLLEQLIREMNQPLTDVLQFFNRVNQDNKKQAIAVNEYLSEEWGNLLQQNSKLPDEEQKDYKELRDDLVKIVNKKYPQHVEKLSNHLKRVDSGKPIEIERVKHDITLKDVVYNEDDYRNIESKTKDGFDIGKLDDIALFTPPKETPQIPYVSQESTLATATMYSFPQEIGDVNKMMRAIPIDLVELPEEFNELYQLLYLAQTAVMLTHTMTIEDNKFTLQYQIQKSIEEEISPFAKIKNFFYEEDNTKKAEVEVKEFEGEGSREDLMLYEFQKSFNSYKNSVTSKEVNKIAKVVDNFINVNNLDVNTLHKGKYQALRISTKIGDEGHSESILTDGNFLFWINRGADTSSNAKPGIKLFKIIKNLDEVKNTLKGLKGMKPQAEARKAIYSLLREEDDNELPEHVWIPMSPQKIGNCGWTQTKGMLKIIAIASNIGELTELPDVESQEWQKAVKNADDIYKDFTKYDRVIRAEAVAYSMDKNFKTIFLSEEEKNKIDARRDILEKPVTFELLQKISDVFNNKITKFENTIYQKQVGLLKDFFNIESALHSDLGKSLSNIETIDNAKHDLKLYQENDMNNFEELYKIYELIKSEVDDEEIIDQVFHNTLHEIIEKKYSINNLESFTQGLTQSINSCELKDEDTINCFDEELITLLNEYS